MTIRPKSRWQATATVGHVLASADGGSDSLFNMQAEHWQTNLDKEASRQRLDEGSGLTGRLAMLDAASRRLSETL